MTIHLAAQIVIDALKANNKILICGNGGSSAKSHNEKCVARARETA